MTAFLGSFLQYLIIMILLIVVAFVAIKLGIALRKNKDAKEAAVSAATSEGTSSENIE